MTRAAVALVLAAGLALAASPAAVQDNLSKRVSLDLKAMAPNDAFKVIADAVGMKVTVDAKVTAPIDILVQNVTARTALTAICESIGCVWKISGSAIVVSPADRSAPTPPIGSMAFSASVKQTGGTFEQKRLLLEQIQAALKQPLPAGLKFENAPLSTVSGRLSEALGLTITMTSGDPAITTMTADFSNQSLMSALKGLGGGKDGDAPPLRLTISEKSVPGGTVTPSVMIGIRWDPKKK